MEDQCLGWRLRHRVRRALGRALDGDLCAARGCPARGGRSCRFSRSRRISRALLRGLPACGCGPADLVAAPRPEGSRPAGRGRPPAPQSARCPSPRPQLQALFSRQLAQSFDALAYPRPNRPGPDGLARRRRALEAVEKVVTVHKGTSATGGFRG